MKDDFALIIGINDYTPQKFNGPKSLAGAIRDANLFEKWVIDKKGGGVLPSNCEKIISNPDPLNPIQNQIDEAYKRLHKLIRANGNKARRFYFYFSGHGIGLTTNRSKEVALCLANWSEDERNEALGAELYQDAINQYGYFEEIIFILDCCRNTKVNVTPKHPSFTPQEVPTSGQAKTFTAYATQHQQKAGEVKDGNEGDTTGIFTSVLLNGLKGDAPNDNGIITADGLKDYLMKQTPIEAQKKGFKQIPQIIVDSFTAETPFMSLVNYSDEAITCYIIFSETRNNEVQLIDGSGNVTSYNASEQKNVEVSLPKGLYLLRDTVTGEKISMKVAQFDSQRHFAF